MKAELTAVKQINIPTPEAASGAMYGKNAAGMLAMAAKGLAKFDAIQTEDQKTELDAHIRVAKKAIKDLGELREGYTKPLVALQKALIAGEKLFLADLSAEVAKAEGLVNAFLKAQLKAKQEAEAKLAAEKAAEMKRLRKPESIAAVELKFQAKEQTIAAPSGSKTVWKFEVVDPSKVPAFFLVVSEQAIRTAVANGERQIAGVRIFEDISRSGR